VERSRRRLLARGGSRRLSPCRSLRTTLGPIALAREANDRRQPRLLRRTGRAPVRRHVCRAAAPIRTAGPVPDGGAVAGASHPEEGPWVAAYCLAAVLPLAAVLVSSPPGGRGLVVELASALGIVTLTLLALQLVLPARMRVVARPLGAEVAIRLHRHMADLLVAADRGPRGAGRGRRPLQPGAFRPARGALAGEGGGGSCVALAALIATSLLRRGLRLPYEVARAPQRARDRRARARAAARDRGRPLPDPRPRRPGHGWAGRPKIMHSASGLGTPIRGRGKATGGLGDPSVSWAAGRSRLTIGVMPMPQASSTNRSAPRRGRYEPCGPSTSSRVPGRSCGTRLVKSPWALIVNAGRCGGLALEEYEKGCSTSACGASASLSQANWPGRKRHPR
jgi:hypothetical protein